MLEEVPARRLATPALLVNHNIPHQEGGELGDSTTSVHLLSSVAIQSVDFSVKSLFMPDSSGAFIKASLEMHALITSPSERFHIARCSMVLQKQ